MEQVKKRVLYGILILVTLFIFRIAWLDVGTGEKIFAFLGQCATGIPGLMGWYNSIQEEKKKTDAGEQKNDREKKVNLKVIRLVVVINVIVGSANSTLAMIYNEWKSVVLENNPNIESANLVDMVPSVMLTWTNDIYLIQYKEANVASLDDVSIINALERYAKRFINGEDTCPIRKSVEDLETGLYGELIKEANGYQEDRNKISSEKLKKYSIWEEVDCRKRANEIAEEADNLKILGTLYKLREASIALDISEEECLKKSLRYLIAALSLAYYDEYGDDYIISIWREIADTYERLSNSGYLDDGEAQVTRKIADVIKKYRCN